MNLVRQVRGGRTRLIIFLPLAFCLYLSLFQANNVLFRKMSSLSCVWKYIQIANSYWLGYDVYNAKIFRTKNIKLHTKSNVDVKLKQSKMV